MLQQGGYAAVPPSTIGMGGYTFAFSDGVAMGSTACISTLAFCGMGTIGAANPPAYTIYGGGIGVNLNQLMATGAAMQPINAYAATGAGINYALSAVPPAGTRLIIDNSPAYVQGPPVSGVVDYCAPITLQTATIPWATFNTKCWDGTGTALAAAPATAHHIQVEVTSGAAAGAFNFCVTSLKFM